MWTALKFLLLLLCLFCCSGIPEPCITENGNADIESSLSRNEFKEVLSGKGLKFVHQNICGLEANFNY